MSTPFSHSMRSLAADASHRSTVVLSIVAALLGLWLLWFFEAEVAVYEVADVARLEVDRVAYRIDAPVTGQVEAVHLELGREIQAGEVLVQLEATGLRLELVEKRAYIAALSQEIEQIERQLETAETARQTHAIAMAATVDEARARRQETAERAKLARDDAERQSRLFREGHVSVAEAERAVAEAKARDAQDVASNLTVDRVMAEGRAKESDLAGEIADLKRQLAQLRGQKSADEAAADRLAYELERRSIRAPVSGRIGEITVLQVRSMVHEGDRIAVIVPEGGVRAVATFSALTAIGRVRPGQRGSLRLAGFPWVQYGKLDVVVASVASESHDGGLRVELEVEPDPRSAIPLQHGLAGSVEVEVERASPAVLVLRAAGHWVRGEQRARAEAR